MAHPVRNWFTGGELHMELVLAPGWTRFTHSMDASAHGCSQEHRRHEFSGQFLIRLALSPMPGPTSTATGRQRQRPCTAAGTAWQASWKPRNSATAVRAPLEHGPPKVCGLGNACLIRLPVDSRPPGYPQLNAISCPGRVSHDQPALHPKGPFQPQRLPPARHTGENTLTT